MTDPRHSLYGRKFKLAGIACVPGHVRHCRVEIMSGVYGLIPVASTNLSTTPRPEPTILTLPALEEMVACFLALPVVRRKYHATNRQSKRMGSSDQRRLWACQSFFRRSEQIQISVRPVRLSRI